MSLSDERVRDYEDTSEEFYVYPESKVRESVRRIKENEKIMIKRFDDFCKCIDFGKVALTNEAIVFMNDMFNGDCMGIHEEMGESLV